MQQKETPLTPEPYSGWRDSGGWGQNLYCSLCERRADEGPLDVTIQPRGPGILGHGIHQHVNASSSSAICMSTGIAAVVHVESVRECWSERVRKCWHHCRMSEILLRAHMPSSSFFTTLIISISCFSVSARRRMLTVLPILFPTRNVGLLRGTSG